jgi:hypothetical protein
MSGSSVCFNCKSRGTECINQSGDGGPLQVRRRLPEREPGKSREFERRSTTRNKTNDLRGSDVLENSTTDRRAPFIAVLDGSGVSLNMAILDPLGFNRQYSFPTPWLQEIPLWALHHHAERTTA